MPQEEFKLCSCHRRCGGGNTIPKGTWKKHKIHRTYDTDHPLWWTHTNTVVTQNEDVDQTEPREDGQAVSRGQRDRTRQHSCHL